MRREGITRETEGTDPEFSSNIDLANEPPKSAFVPQP